MTELELVRRQLVAIRDLAETTLGILDAGDGASAPSTDCPHPKEQRRPAGVMGDPHRYLCLACSTIVQTSAPAAPAAPAPAPAPAEG